MSKGVHDRIDKLRRMAEHPRSNPHEAAVARTEMERLLKLHPEPVRHDRTPLSWLDVGRAPDMETFAARYAEMQRLDEERIAAAIGPVAYAAYKQRMADWRAKRAWHDAERALYHRGEHLRSEAMKWTATLRPGDRVRTLHQLGLYEGPPLPSEILTVERRTPSGIVVTNDGSKWNAWGYRQGERVAGVLTYIVAVGR